MDYMDLVRQLSDVKRRMAKISDLQRFSRPDNGESFVLAYLGNSLKSVTSKEIMQAMNISSARIAVILNQLEKKGLICRKESLEDRRYVIIELLPEGAEQHQKNIEKFNQWAVRLLEALGPEDAVEYVRLQNKVVDIYTNDFFTREKDSD